MAFKASKSVSVLVFILLAVRALMLKSCVCLFLGQFDFPRLLSLFVLIVFDNSIDCAELAALIYRTSNSLCVFSIVVFVRYSGPVFVNFDMFIFQSVGVVGPAKCVCVNLSGNRDG